MPQTKRTPTKPTKAATNGAGTQEILTLAEAAAYLRVPEHELLKLCEQEDIPGRKVGNEWRFYRPALQNWLAAPSPKRKGIWTSIGAFKDDPHLDEIVKEAMRRRGRPTAEDE